MKKNHLAVVFLYLKKKERDLWTLFTTGSGEESEIKEETVVKKEVYM